MKKKLFITLALAALLGLLISGCVRPTPTPTPEGSGAGIANPASVYCNDNGGQSVIRTAADGSQTGVCVFPDKSECDEWAYFRKECGPGTPGPVTQ